MGNESRVSAFLTVMLLLACKACMEVKNPPVRNTIQFDISIKEVTDSLRTMDRLFRSSVHEHFKCYYIDDTTISLVNYSDNPVKTSPGNTRTHSELMGMSPENAERLGILSSFLGRNYVDGCIKRGDWILFIYRNNIYMADYQTDLDRYIAFGDSSTYSSQYKTIANVGDMLLLAHKEARIWADE